MKTLPENFCGAYDGHVLRDMPLPLLLIPQIDTHISTKYVHWLIKISHEDGMLLENQLHRIDLFMLEWG
jgi:hypothetical protein